MKIRDLQEQYDRIYKLMMKSPLRSDSPILKISSMGRFESALDEQDRRLRIVGEELTSPLKILVLGEVKAGKSSLINAILSQNVTPEGIGETTAMIIEITHGENEQAKIFYKDLSSEKLSLSEWRGKADEIQKNPEDYLRVEKVELQLNNKMCQLFKLVDSPGILTWNEDNVETTKNYLDWCDVVLWVLNGNYLGQSDVIDEIEQTQSSGKPIVCVVNRIDEVRGNPEDVKGYVESEYGLYFEEVILASAKNYGEKGNSTGVSNLLQFLEEKYASSKEAADKAKWASVESTLNALVKTEDTLHRMLIESGKLLVEDFSKLKQELDYHRSNISDTLRLQIENTADGYFRENLDELLGFVDEMKTISNRKEHEKRVLSKLNSVLSENEMRDLLNRIASQVETAFETQWKRAMDKIMTTRNERLAAMKDGEDKELFDQLNGMYLTQSGSVLKYDNEDSRLMGSVFDGLAIGTGAAATLSVYYSALAAGAAYTSFGAVFSSVFPPLAVFGAGVGAVKIIRDSKKKKKELKDLVVKQLNTAKDNFMSDIIGRRMLTYIEQRNSDICSLVLKDYENKVLTSNNINDLQSFVALTTAHCEEIECFSIDK